MRYRRRGGATGYTLVELMLVIVIIGVLGSIVFPQMDRVLQRAYQAKAKSNLGNLRSTINLYYADHDGRWPLMFYPQGWSHIDDDGLALSSVLIPKYTHLIPTPQLQDRLGTFNALSQSYDEMARTFMAMSPPRDVYIVWGPADYLPLLAAPWAYDNRTGLVYYANGNYDTSENYFYDW